MFTEGKGLVADYQAQMQPAERWGPGSSGPKLMPGNEASC